MSKLSHKFAFPIGAVIIIFSIITVYQNTFDSPFIFDDEFSIQKNHSIRTLWPPDRIFSPPGQGNPVQGRPILNLTFAINYALGKLNVGGYHFFNLMIHITVALLLFSIIQTTLQSKAVLEQFRQNSTGLAFMVVLLWAVHPLNTSAVTYITQRAESLVTLFYLLTTYCVIRSSLANSKSGIMFWSVTATITCALGMATKEVMISAPVIIFTYDALFLSGSIKGTLKRRWPLYSALAITWSILAYLVIGTQGRGGTAGIAAGANTVLQYGATQCWAIVQFLKLSFWPAPLVFDYGTNMISSVWQALPYTIIIIILLSAIFSGFLYRKYQAAFAGAFVFAVLAPSSSFVPVLTQTVAEHRMYLPLTSVILLSVLGAFFVFNILLTKARFSSSGTRSLLLYLVPISLCATASIILGNITLNRNNDYRSELSIWFDTMNKRPLNARAAMYVGTALLNSKNGNLSENEFTNALQMFDRAISVDSTYGLSFANRGVLLFKQKKFKEAHEDYSRAIALKVNRAELFNNRGIVYCEFGMFNEAIDDFLIATRIDPSFVSAYRNLGAASTDLAKGYISSNEPENAVQMYKQAVNYYSNAIRYDSSAIEAYKGRASAYASMGMWTDASDDCTQIMKINRSDADAFGDRAICFYNLNRFHEAWQDVEECKRLGGLPNTELIMLLAQAIGIKE